MRLWTQSLAVYELGELLVVTPFGAFLPQKATGHSAVLFLFGFKGWPSVQEDDNVIF